MSDGHHARHATRLAVALALCAVLMGSAAASMAGVQGTAGLPGPAPAARTTLSVDLANATELFANQSVSGSTSPPAAPLFKVFANRSLAAPETLLVTLEASGGGFATGSLQIFDPHQVLIDARYTLNDGDINASSFIVPETGYYLLAIHSAQLYYWSVTVNRTVGGAPAPDNDNDLQNASWLAPPQGTLSSSVTDGTDLVDVYAINLTVSGALADTILLNLTSPGTADLDLYLFHLEGGLAVFDSVSDSPLGTEYAAAFATANRTYYAWVMSFAGSSPYALEWAVFTSSYDDNSGPSTATPLGTGNYSNGLARWDLYDMFRFDVPANTTLNVSSHTLGYNATAGAPDLQLTLWNATFSRVSWSFLFDPDERINALLAEPGTYYLYIFLADNAYFLAQNLTMNYTLSVRVDPPPVLFDPNWSAVLPEDTPGVVDLRALIPQDPLGEPLSYRIAAVGANTTAALGADGHTLTVTPAPDWSGNATVSVEAADEWQTVLIDLLVSWSPVNDAPRLVAGAETFWMDEDAPAGFAFAAVLADPEGDVVTVTGVDPQPPLSASLLPAGVSLSAPPNFNGNVLLALDVGDSGGASVTLTMTIAIRPVNDPPVFQTAVGPFVFYEDSDVANASFPVAALAMDLDGDALTYDVSDIPNVIALIVNGTLTLHPAPDFSGDVAGTLVARDAQSTTSIAFQVHVLPVNDPPALAFPLTQRVARENETFALNAEATDIDTPPGDLRYSFFLDGAPLTRNSTSPSISVPFSFDGAGYHVLRVEVSDGEFTAAGDIPLFVAETNRPPTAQILSPRDLSFKAGEVVTFSARASDPDGQDVNLSWIVDGTLVSSSPTFSLEGMGPGSHTILLIVSDGDASAIDEASFTVGGSAPGPGLAALVVALAAAAVSLRKRRD